MSNYTEGFNTDPPDGWTITAGEYITTDGYGLPGCYKFTTSSSGVGYADINEEIEAGDSIYFACKAIQGNLGSGLDMVTLSVEINNGATILSEPFATTPVGADWVVYSTSLAPYVGSFVTDVAVTMQVAAPGAYVLIDDVTIDIDPPAPPEVGGTVALSRSSGGIPGAVLV